jgi:hypothetical protein
MVKKTSCYIFGYGSLVNQTDWVNQERSGQVVYGYLGNHQRHFEVGIDNLSPKYNQKHYRENGRRANAIIGTLGINYQQGSTVNGLAIPVDEKLFEKINIREKSYLLSEDLRDLFDQDLKYPLFSYYPKEENYQLYKNGLKAGRIFMPSHYFNYCLDGFKRLGGEDDFIKLTKELDYPIKDLEFYRSPGSF